MDETATNLIPCPFCGEEDGYITESSDGDLRMAGCHKCGANGPWDNGSRAAAAELWNTRHAPWVSVEASPRANAVDDGGELMSDFEIGDLNNQEAGEAIEQGVFRAFSEMLESGVAPRADLLQAVQNGVEGAFRGMMDATGSHPFTRADIFASIQEGTRQAQVERNNEEEN